MKKANAIKTYNAVRSSSAKLTAALPLGTENNISEVRAAILEYVPAQNEFIDVLVNKIYLTIILNRRFNNPLAPLKSGNSPLGSDIEEIHVNPVQAAQYNPTAETLLQQSPPDVAVAYHRLNRQDVYKLTVERMDLRQAFTSWEAFGDMIDANVNALYSGNYIDEFRLMTGTFNSALASDAIRTQIIDAVTDADSAKALVSKMRALNRKFQLPTTAFNSYAAMAGEGASPRVTWCNPEDIVILITADIEATVSVDVLAAAFNMDKTSFVASQVVVVDSFGVDSAIQAVMIDRAFIRVYDNLYIAEPFRNPETLATTYFLHVWQTYSTSPFANGVAFITEYTALTVEPSDWATNYTAYYTKSGDTYSAVTGETAPTFEAGTYYRKNT